ncbi:hypothetical protein AB0B45_30505 [Nonomuraea sp. NPDC049152]|uniref:hypothetical protein n=1 Tax=Nonomuraea sp. NPDC049152 TaxID=3154350 RepID=UPI0033E20502
MIDQYARLAGWPIAERRRADLVVDAAHAATVVRARLDMAIFQSDSAQDASRQFTGAWRQWSVRQSIGVVGSSADYAEALRRHAATRHLAMRSRLVMSAAFTGVSLAIPGQVGMPWPNDPDAAEQYGNVTVRGNTGINPASALR